MKQPRFSVVIPTRERAETLGFALQTCLNQDFTDYEIVVADNCSSPDTKRTVDAYASPQIRYIRSDKPLAMSDNWEMGVSCAAGEYVIVIGDDDALLSDALRNIDRILKRVGTKALRWERVYYSWPNIPIAEDANILHIPFIRCNEYMNGETILRDIIQFQSDYTLLPMLYNSAIHSDLIRRAKSQSGRLFAARSPDIYSGVVFAYLAGTYLSSGRPMSINAGSAKSNGVAATRLPEGNPITQEFHTLSNSSNLACHPTVPNIATVVGEMANCFQCAKDIFFKHNSALELDRKQLTIACIAEVSKRSLTDEVKFSRISQIREALSDDASLLAWFDDNAPRMLSESVIACKSDGLPQLGFDGHTLHINAKEFGVTDVAGAAQLSVRLMGEMQDVPEFRKSVRQMSYYRRFRSAARILVKGH